MSVHSMLKKNIAAKESRESCYKYVCDDISSMGIDILYLITDHISFYERYGWTFLCVIQGDGEPNKTRTYNHQNTK